MEGGVILSTGLASQAERPNRRNSTTADFGGDRNAQLDALLRPGTNTLTPLCCRSTLPATMA
jgi:hypothetical protein